MLPAFAEISRLGPSCITIGNFDGAHLGHQKLISAALALSECEKLAFILMTFWPHPRSVLGAPHLPLSARPEKLRLLTDLGANNILEIPFDGQFAALPPEIFIREWLLPLNPRHLVVGHDFCFGRDRRGDLALLEEWGRAHGFAVHQVPPLLNNDQAVSSSLIRKYILRGEVARAAVLLGRPYALTGSVEHGFGRGTELGFPTANLKPDAVLLPANGVYATRVSAGARQFNAVTNIGQNPTFNGCQVSVESFLLDTDADLYGQNLRIEFFRRLRDERKFASPAALATQIGRDVAEARAILQSAPTAGGHERG